MNISKLAVAALLAAAAPADAAGTCDRAPMPWVDCAPGFEPRLDPQSCKIICVEQFRSPQRPWDGQHGPHRLPGDNIQKQAAELTGAVRGGDIGAGGTVLTGLFDGGAAVGGSNPTLVNAAGNAASDKLKEGVERALDRLGDKLRDRNDDKLREGTQRHEQTQRDNRERQRKGNK